MKRKVAVALSGGVDSAVTAGLLKQEGWEVFGFHLRLWTEEEEGANERIKKVKKIAEVLKIPFEVLDLRREFKKKVVDYFLREFINGRTPNPCIRCNQEIKFGRLLKFSLNEMKADYLATGHYARVGHSRPYKLFRGVDKKKDQSYFLYTLTQKQLSYLLFPLGKYRQRYVLKLAKRWKLPISKKSRAICFFKEKDYRFFLKRQIPQKLVPGEVSTLDGKVIGRHLGLPLYTIGQRHGFELKKKVLGPMYVVGKEVGQNRLIVGFGGECERGEFKVGEANWIAGQAPKLPLKCQVKIRHQGQLLNCELSNYQIANGRLRVILAEPQQGVAPGQSAVFYKGEEVLGGGIICGLTKIPAFVIIQLDERKEKEAGEKDTVKGWKEKSDYQVAGIKKKFWEKRIAP